MRNSRLVATTVLSAGVLALAILAFAGYFADHWVAPPCEHEGYVFTYSVRYYLDPNEEWPTVWVKIYKGFALFTQAMMEDYDQGELWVDYMAGVELDEDGNNYWYKFVAEGGPSTTLYPGPVVKDPGQNCP